MQMHWVMKEKCHANAIGKKRNVTRANALGNEKKEKVQLTPCPSSPSMIIITVHDRRHHP
jgi:hypothetical protein